MFTLARLLGRTTFEDVEASHVKYSMEMFGHRSATIILRSAREDIFRAVKDLYRQLDGDKEKVKAAALESSEFEYLKFMIGQLGIDDIAGEMRKFYDSIGTPPETPPEDITRISAEEDVRSIIEALANPAQTLKRAKSAAR